jgi:hypothetical protein
MPLPAALSGILAVSSLPNIANHLSDWLRRAKAVCRHDKPICRAPSAAPLPQRRTSVDRSQRETLTVALKGKAVTRSQTQLAADLTTRPALSIETVNSMLPLYNGATR